jgi:3-hydroxyacyl-[acyl-carrier-protein] dehydratase
VKVLNWRTRAAKMQGAITVEGKLVAEAVITCMLVPREAKPAPAKAAETAE